MKQFLSLFAVICLLICQYSCRNRQADSDLESGTHKFGQYTFLFKIADDPKTKTPLIYRYQCAGKAPYGEVNCKDNQEIRQWDKLKSEINNSLSASISIATTDISHLKTNISNTEGNPALKKAYEDELALKNTHLSYLTYQEGALKNIETVLRNPATITLDSKGNVLSGESLTQLIDKFDNSGFIENEELAFGLVARFGNLRLSSTPGSPREPAIILDNYVSRLEGNSGSPRLEEKDWVAFHFTNVESKFLDFEKINMYSSNLHLGSVNYPTEVIVFNVKNPSKKQSGGVFLSVPKSLTLEPFSKVKKILGDKFNLELIKNH